MTQDHDPAPVWLPGGVTAVPGFTASGVHAGIKHRKPDVALIAAEQRCTAAAVYTLNALQAAPLGVCRRHLADGYAQAVVVVSGIANTCTGAQGVKDAEAMAAETAQRLGIAKEDVIVASTGVIGPLLPMDKVRKGIDMAAAALSPNGGPEAAVAIMTTDTRPKTIACKIALGDDPEQTITIGGIAKGSGMIHPNMATMLAFLTTDAAIDATLLHRALQEVVAKTFNAISVDGDTSPNDMVAIMASGSAEHPPLRPGEPAWRRFMSALHAVCEGLAKEIVRDGEGARQMFGVDICGAIDDDQALTGARAVVSSYLVKTAVYGHDANWGRVLTALGKSGIQLDIGRTLLSIRWGDQEIVLFKDGEPLPFDEAEASALLSRDGVTFAVDVGLGGPGRAVAWGCDLTEEYIHINAAYRT